jgi:hypothetical protein
MTVATRLEDAMGCLLAIFGGIFPRLAVLILWIARPERIDAAFSTFLWPLLGIIFLPFATLIYLLLYTPGRGLRGWDWFWVVLAALLRGVRACLVWRGTHGESAVGHRPPPRAGPLL